MKFFGQKTDRGNEPGVRWLHPTQVVWEWPVVGGDQNHRTSGKSFHHHHHKHIKSAFQWGNLYCILIQTAVTVAVQLSHRLKRKHLCCISSKTGYICQQAEKILQLSKWFSLFKPFCIFLFRNQRKNPSFQDLESLRGKNVLIVEDIIDTGRTMKKLLNTLNK